MNPTIHGHGILYEHLMCRAFQCWPDPRKGAYSGHYYAVYWSLHGHLPRKYTHENEVAKLKKHLTKAFQCFLKRRLRKTEKEVLQTLLIQLVYAQNEDDLFKIVEAGLTATQRLADFQYAQN